MRWEEISDHTADTGLKVWGRTPELALAAAVVGFVNLVTDPGTLVVDMETRGGTELWLDFTGDLDIALRDLLNELLYFLEVKDKLPMTIMAVDIIDNEFLVLDTHFGKWVDGISESRTEIKAITWQDLRLSETENGWFGYVVFDV
jgi:SHS2 domain-containing protein